MNYAIIAAGKGSRLAQEGVAKPKPLVEINGESLIHRLIRIFSRNNAENIFIICNEEMTDVQEYIQSLKADYPSIRLLVKSTPSSMHSLWELSKLMTQQTDTGTAPRFILTTVDTIFNESEFSAYVKAFEQDETADALMGLTTYIDDEKPLYAELSSQEMPLPHPTLITGYHDTPNNCTHISAGIYGLTATAIPVLNRCIATGQSRMRNFQRALIEARLTVKPFAFSDVFDIDHAADIQKAINRLQPGA